MLRSEFYSLLAKRGVSLAWGRKPTSLLRREED